MESLESQISKHSQSKLQMTIANLSEEIKMKGSGAHDYTAKKPSSSQLKEEEFLWLWMRKYSTTFRHSGPKDI